LQVCGVYNKMHKPNKILKTLEEVAYE